MKFLAGRQEILKCSFRGFGSSKFSGNKGEQLYSDVAAEQHAPASLLAKAPNVISSVYARTGGERAWKIQKIAAGCHEPLPSR